MKYLLSCLVMLVSLNANAAFLGFNAGDFKFTGDTYIDTTQPNNTRAIGRVTTITQGGNIVWSSGDNGEYINFLVDGIAPVVSPVAPLFNFVGTGGTIDFWTNTSDVFDPSQDYVTQASVFQTGSLYLSADIYGDVIGIATGVSYSSNGFANVTGGTAMSILDTNSRVAFDGSLTDISFGLSGTNNTNPLVNTDYEYIVSADAQGAATNIPEPMPLALLGAGLLGLAGSIRIKQK